MINKIKNFIRTKIKYLSLLSLPMLTGCNTTDYVYHGRGFFDALGAFSNGITNFLLGMLQLINGVVTASLFFMKDLVSGSYTQITSFLGSISNFTEVINIISFLAVCTIIVRFAWSVFRENLADADNRYASDIFTRFKKIVVAAIATFAVPYCIITGFLAASAGGVMITDAMFSDTNLVGFEVYEAMDKSGVSFATYCSEGQKAAGAKDLSSLYGYEVSESSKGAEGMNIEVLTPQSQAYTPNGSSAYSYYCQGNGGLGESDALNVWQAFINSPNTQNVVSIGGKSNAMENVGSYANLIGSVFTVFGSVAVFIVAMFCILKRVVDVLMLIFMSWWYIGASVSDTDNRSLGSLTQNALKLMLSQFLFCFELAILLTLTLQIANPLQKGIMMIVMSIVLLNTPTVVQELVVGTSGVDEASKLGRSAFRGVKNFFGS